MNIGPLELTIILAIVILIFGVGRIGRIGGELGSAIRAFREGLNENGDEPEDANKAATDEVEAKHTEPPDAAP